MWKTFLYQKLKLISKFQKWFQISLEIFYTKTELPHSIVVYPASVPTVMAMKSGSLSLNSLQKNSNFLRYKAQLLVHLSLFVVPVTRTVKHLSTFTLFHHLFSFRPTFEVLAGYHFSILLLCLFQSPEVIWPTPYYSDTFCIVFPLPSLY
jgi:hypothetical protein